MTISPDQQTYVVDEYRFDGPAAAVRRDLMPVPPTRHCEQWSFPGSLIVLTVAVEDRTDGIDAARVASLYLRQHEARGPVDIQDAVRPSIDGADEAIAYRFAHRGSTGEALVSLLGVAVTADLVLAWHVTWPADAETPEAPGLEPTELMATMRFSTNGG